MAKRKAEELEPEPVNGSTKKRATDSRVIADRFSDGLFTAETIERYANQYATSKPWKHGVVTNLIKDSLLRNVRSEIKENIQFTPKETDIYKIHQSGDLANLDGLSESSLERLPSLLQLRDALYGYEFRQWLSQVTGAGLLSGKKTDMAVNVYVPGCHLLCHDDVIGSRRVSYILYLNDPDINWWQEYGGALRLYPQETTKDEDGKEVRLPSSMWSKSIVPSWNQLSFFAVQPGESFHDVEEVYHKQGYETENDGGRVRMAISGWFHIPQEGEEGFEPGLEEKLAEKSSLQQLQGPAYKLESPAISWQEPKGSTENIESWDAEDVGTELSESDLDFLLKYITPNYLTPDTVEELNELFSDESLMKLSNFLNAKFSERLKEWLESDEAEIWQRVIMKTSRPPHKHRFRYLSSHVSPINENENPMELLLNELLPSLAFRKWLSMVTGLTLRRCSIIARHFRRFLDYELARAYEGDVPQLEYCLCVTPSSGWGGENETVEVDRDSSGARNGSSNGHATSPSIGKGRFDKAEESDNVGGFEMYMAGDDDEDDDGSDHGVEIPQSHTGAGNRRMTRRKKVDPAVYQAAGDDEDDGILVSDIPDWNSLRIVLRDRGTLRFVKYVSQSAPGDRYDFSGCVEVEEDDDEEDDEGEQSG